MSRCGGNGGAPELDRWPALQTTPLCYNGPILLLSDAFMDIIALLQYINERHGMSFRPLSKLAGGFQDGAYELVDTITGQRAVLKPRFAPYAPPVVERLRQVGYPTPAWLCFGTTPDGTSCTIQEFVPGTPMQRLTPIYLDQIFALNDLQANLNPNAKTDHWSGYAWNVVFANESNWAANIQAYAPETAELLSALTAAVQPYREISLPTTDIVHGDFNPDNLLVNNGEITAIIDCTYAGYGTRVIDLATLLHYAYAFDYGDEVRARLYEQSMKIAGPAVLAVCLVYRTMAMLDWVIHRDTQAAVLSYVHAAWQMLEEFPTDIA
jgi:hypothetical protein